MRKPEKGGEVRQDFIGWRGEGKVEHALDYRSWGARLTLSSLNHRGAEEHFLLLIYNQEVTNRVKSPPLSFEKVWNNLNAEIIFVEQH